MSSILEKIVDRKREDLARIPAREATTAPPPPRDFLAALTAGDQSDRVSLIAEVKKASPSKGLIRADFQPAEIAKSYQAGGASCISVLTDEPFFQGHLDYLAEVRAAVDLPVLRKDFILEPSQIHEARAFGADAVLLIAECLEPGQLKDLHDLVVELGMTPLVELYETSNLESVLACQPKLVGVNNRDLRTFEVDLNHAIRLRHEIPDDIALVSESGIFTAADIQQMHEHHIDAVLVGESLMRQSDIRQAVEDLMGPTSLPGPL